MTTPRFTRKNYGNSHAYYVDGTKIPGVTSIIGVLDKPALVNWAANVTAGYAVDNWDRLSGMPISKRLDEVKRARWNVNKTATVRGKRVHAAAERLARGEGVLAEDQDIQSAAEVYVRLLDAWKLEPILLEGSVVNYDYQYAGTLDGIFHSPKLGTILVDVKGLALDTAIPTPDGWTTMAHIQVGDQVFAADGSICTVRIKSAIKRIGTYVVTFDTGEQITCDSEHIWWTQGRREAAPSAKPIADVIATLDYSGQKNHRVPMARPLDLPERDLPIDPYLLGCWLGDGKAKGGEITKGEDLFEILAADGHQLGVEQPEKGDCTTRTVLGLRSLLIEHGLFGNKHIPAVYLRAGFRQRLNLVQGLMDTDGTWNTARNRAEFVSTDAALARQVMELLYSLGQRPHWSSTERSGFGVTVTAYSVEWTPIGIAPFRLPRKSAKVTPKRVPYCASRRMIVSIDPGPDVETACIGVDSEDHTYLCGPGMIPTHNTGKRAYSEVALQLAAYRYCDSYLAEVEQRGPRGGKLPSTWAETPMPLVDGCAVIHIEQATDESPAAARLLPVKAGATEFDVFLYLREVHAAWIERTGYDHRKQPTYSPPIGAELHPEMSATELQELIRS